MYVQFDLKFEHVNDPVAQLETALWHWSHQFDIYNYRIKIVKGRMRVTFENPQHYTVFAMTWNAQHKPWLNFELIEPMQTRPV